MTVQRKIEFKRTNRTKSTTQK